MNTMNCTNCGTVHDSGITETVTACPSCPPRPTVTIILSAANMGIDATEADFDAWASYVAAHIDEALSIDADVDQAAYTGRGALAGDHVSCSDEDTAEAVQLWLSHEGWDAWCSSASADAA